MSDIVDELRAIQSPEECRRLMLWAATVIEKDRQRFIEKVERIKKLEAENKRLTKGLERTALILDEAIKRIAERDDENAKLREWLQEIVSKCVSITFPTYVEVRVSHAVMDEAEAIIKGVSDGVATIYERSNRIEPLAQDGVGKTRRGRQADRGT